MVALHDRHSRQTLAQIDGEWMAPSKLPSDTQERLRARFDQAARQALGTRFAER